uniref:Uncharacterized protein n=1 Tax=Panagrolaimus sp. PS1159 TaxID=55785 RepID=A0AC35GJ55_9BILA
MSKSRPRINGIQSEPNSIDTGSPTSSLSSKLQQAVVISGSTLAGPAAAIKAHKFRQQHETHSVEFPNVPPQRDSTRRLAVGNAILQTAGMATVSVDSIKHPMYFSSRPSTSASAISSSTIPISLRSISVIGKVSFIFFLNPKNFEWIK